MLDGKDVNGNADLDHEASDSYSVRVTATDPSLAGDTITVTVHVDGIDEVPELSGDSVVSVTENARGAIAAYRATDPERAPLNWMLTGEDQAAFQIIDGSLRFRQPPDYESPTDADGHNTYEVTVEVSDQTHTVSLEVTVLVRDLDETRGQNRPPGGGGSSSGGGGGGGGSSGGGGGEQDVLVSAGFVDVDPSSVHAASTDALFAAKITVGCGRETLRYCPDQPMTRAQMASFLARSLNLGAA